MEDKEILELNKHISDDIILQDIHDTEREIKELKTKIERRDAFIEKLRYLLDLRHPEKTEEAGG